MLALADHIVCLNKLADAEQEYKDCLHEKLNRQCTLVPDTDCWLYTGGSILSCGQIRIKVGTRTYHVGRIAAWLYVGGFEIWDSRLEVVHTCRHLSCFNPDHLRIVSGRSEALRIINRLRRLKRTKR